MKKVEVNLPDSVYKECIAYSPDDDAPVALEQAVKMYSWVGVVLTCMSQACQRDVFLAQSFDLGEPKSEVRARWDAADAKRFAPYQFPEDDEVQYGD